MTTYATVKQLRDLIANQDPADLEILIGSLAIVVTNRFSGEPPVAIRALGLLSGDCYVISPRRFSGCHILANFLEQYKYSDDTEVYFELGDGHLYVGFCTNETAYEYMVE